MNDRRLLDAEADEMTTHGENALIFWGIAFGGYFLPTIVALGRGHRNAGAIAVLDVLLGWTILGWVIALVWACTATAHAVEVERTATKDQAPTRGNTKGLAASILLLCFLLCAGFFVMAYRGGDESTRNGPTPFIQPSDTPEEALPRREIIEQERAEAERKAAEAEAKRKFEEEHPNEAARQRFGGLLSSAQSFIKAGMYSDAEEPLRRIVNGAPGTEIAAEAKQLVESISLDHRTRDKYGPQLDNAKRLIEAKQFTAAEQSLRQIIDEAPLTSVSMEARRLLRSLPGK